MLSCLLLELLAIAGIVIGAIGEEKGEAWSIPVLIVCLIVLCIAWFPLCGLRVLKPNEALVLTLFGKYIGTLKGEGFYAINPFCVAVNPAAKTKLNQSGDVGNKGATLAPDAAELANKKNFT